MPTDDEKAKMEAADAYFRAISKWPPFPTISDVIGVQPMTVDGPAYVPIDKDGRAYQEPWPSFPGDPGHPPYFRYRHASTGMRVLSDVAIPEKLFIRANEEDGSDAT